MSARFWCLWCRTAAENQGVRPRVVAFGCDRCHPKALSLSARDDIRSQQANEIRRGIYEHPHPDRPGAS